MIRMCSVVVVAILSLGSIGACSGSPDAKQIKEDLIGQSMGLAPSRWRFEALSEFEEFEIIEFDETSERRIYEVEMLLKDIGSGRLYHAEARIVYRVIDGEWKISVVKNNSLERVD